MLGYSAQALINVVKFLRGRLKLSGLLYSLVQLKTCSLGLFVGFYNALFRVSITHTHTCSSDGQVVRASASVAVDSDLIPSRVKPVTLALVFAASLLDAQH